MTEVTPPVGEGSGRSHLSLGGDGRIYLSWTEPVSDSLHAFRFAVLEDEAWSAPRTIATGASWFVNWADFPSLIALSSDHLVAHVLPKSGAGTYAYDVAVTQSTDGGITWSEPRIVHDDGTQTEHGFVSLLPQTAESTGVFWLDGRHMVEAHAGGDHAAPGHTPGAMTLRYAQLSLDDGLSREDELDARTCECCATAAVQTSSGPIVFYRDRSEEDVRDIAYVRWADGQWQAPALVYEDGWRIAGCPVNGPAADASGDRVVVAWFTMAENVPAVQVAFSADAGATFGAPIIIDRNQALGRVDVVLHDDGAAHVSWLARDDDGARILAQSVAPRGTLGAVREIARTSAARASGFPRMVGHGNRLIFSWTDVGASAQGPDESRVRTAVVTR